LFALDVEGLRGGIESRIKILASHLAFRDGLSARFRFLGSRRRVGFKTYSARLLELKPVQLTARDSHLVDGLV
jgi:hypothetical protein